MFVKTPFFLELLEYGDILSISCIKVSLKEYKHILLIISINNIMQQYIIHLNGGYNPFVRLGRGALGYRPFRKMIGRGKGGMISENKLGGSEGSPTFNIETLENNMIENYEMFTKTNNREYYNLAQDYERLLDIARKSQSSNVGESKTDIYDEDDEDDKKEVTLPIRAKTVKVEDEENAKRKAEEEAEEAKRKAEEAEAKRKAEEESDLLTLDKYDQLKNEINEKLEQGQTTTSPSVDYQRRKLREAVKPCLLTVLDYLKTDKIVKTDTSTYNKIIKKLNILSIQLLEYYNEALINMEYKIENHNLVLVTKTTDDKLYSPEVFRDVLSMDESELNEAKNLKVVSPGSLYNDLTTELNISYNTLQTTFNNRYDRLNNIYDPTYSLHPPNTLHAGKIIKTSVVINPLVSKYYDTDNYDGGKDLENLFLDDKDATDYLLNNMSTQLTEKQMGKNIQVVKNLSDELLSADIKTAGFFPFDGIVKFQNDRGKTLDMLFLEFKKYATYSKKYEKYCLLSVLKKEFTNAMTIMFYKSKLTIDSLFINFNTKKITKKDLHKKLTQYCIFDETTNKPSLSFDKIELTYINNYKYFGIPIKFTKLPNLQDSMIIKNAKYNKHKKDYDYLLSVEKNNKYVQTIDNNHRITNIEWKSGKQKEKYDKAIKEKIFTNSKPGDMVVVIGLTDSIIACNISYYMRLGYINQHAINSLELVQSAYDAGYDHYNIPIYWFESIPLN